MSLNPENREHAKKVLLTGAAIAAGTLALRHSKAIVGKRVRSVGIWESGAVVMDYIGRKKGKYIRLSGKPIRGSQDEVIDFEVDNEDISRASLFKLERVFTDNKLQKLRLLSTEILSRAGLYK